MKVLDQTISQITIPTPFAVGDVHTYLIKGDTLSLVDAGVKTKQAWEAVKSQLKSLGYRPGDVEQIILTHHHPDHIGLIEEFPSVKNIVAHKDVNYWLTRDETYFRYYEKFFEEFYTSCGVPMELFTNFDKLRTQLDLVGKGSLTATIQEGDHLPGHPEWQVIDTAGHAQSHLSFIRQNDGVFIGGDHILQHISSNPLVEPPMEGKKTRPKPLLQYRENLQKCLSLGIKLVLPGHGSIINNIHELIPARLLKQEQRAKKVLTLLEKTSMTPFQVCQNLFPNQHETQLNLTLSETIGQLDFLEYKGLINYELTKGVLSYRTV